MKLLRVVVVEDDRLIREGFANLVNESDKYICTAHYDVCEDAIKNLIKDDPQIILMDIGLPGISGIEGIRRIKKIRPQIDIIVVTVHEDDHKVFEALCAGASGYLTKNISPQKLLEAIDETQKGGAPMSTNIARMVVRSFQRNNESPLTTRETEVLQHLAKGKSYTMIADELFIDKETVRTHIKNIYRKLEVNSKSEAIGKANRERLI
jgi:DNA-binding NarL/FixJ family response regulator